MDFRKLHVIIGELEAANIKLASQRDKQALNILALIQSFRILESKYHELSDGNPANCDISDVNGWLNVGEQEPEEGQEIYYEGNLGAVKGVFMHKDSDDIGHVFNENAVMDIFERWQACR